MGTLETNHGGVMSRQEQSPSVDVVDLLRVSSELARPLFDRLDQQTQKAKQKIDDLITGHQEALEGVSRKIEDERQRSDNKFELQKLIGKEEVDEKQHSFIIEYKGKVVTLFVNELFQLNAVEIGGPRINLKTPLKPEYFQRLFSNSQNVLHFLESSKPPLPPYTPLLADGTARFSFMVGADEYMVIGDNDIMNVWLYKIDEKISAEEEREMASLKTETEALTLKIKRKIIKERQLGHPVFNLDDAIFAPPNVFPEIFQPDLQKLNTLLSRLHELEEVAKTFTMTEVRNNWKCVMENLGEDRFRIKNDVKEGMDILKADQDCYKEALFERGVMMRERVYGGDGILGKKTELLPNGGTKVTRTFTYKKAEYYGKERKPGDTLISEIAVYDKDRNLLSSTDYEFGRRKTETRYRDGEVVEVLHFILDTQRPSYKRIEGTKPHRFAFIGRDGKEYRDYNTEHKKDPTLTPDQYIAKLATVFDSPAAWENFSKVFMQYVYDSPDPDHPLMRGTKREHGEYWQTAKETVARVNESGQALGDCDDFAFLAQAVLSKQGIKARVIEIPNHAICVWIKRRPDGNYDAYSICTFGYDKNGNVYDDNSYLAEPAKDVGYKTPQAALNSLFVKYRQRGLGVDKGIHYKVDDGKVNALSIPQRGEDERTEISVNDLVI